MTQSLSRSTAPCLQRSRWVPQVPDGWVSSHCRSAGGVAEGIALGIAIAFLAARLLRGSDRARIQVAATIAGAYGAYFAADALALSGIFSTIAFGIAFRYLERSWITLRLAEDVGQFWDLAALLANVLVFFMVGAALQLGQSSSNRPLAWPVLPRSPSPASSSPDFSC